MLMGVVAVFVAVIAGVVYNYSRKLGMQCRVKGQLDMVCMLVRFAMILRIV